MTITNHRHLLVPDPALVPRLEVEAAVACAQCLLHQAVVEAHLEDLRLDLLVAAVAVVEVTVGHEGRLRAVRVAAVHHHKVVAVAVPSSSTRSLAELAVCILSTLLFVYW